jgi:hypothetical protein
MQRFNGITAGGEDGSLLPHLLLSDGSRFSIKSGDWLWIKDASGATLFSGVYIQQSSVALIAVAGAEYGKFCFFTQLGVAPETWVSLFVKYEPGELAVPAGLSCFVLRSKAMLAVYAAVEKTLQYQLPPFNFSYKKIDGTLEAFFETGTEGIWWSVYENGKEGYDGLNTIESGDWLTVKNLEGKILFRGLIQRDNFSGWTRYPMNPDCGQPAALGRWIHWTQAGWQPNDWAKLFFEVKDYKGTELASGETNYPAVLIQSGILRFFGKLAEQRLNTKKRRELADVLPKEDGLG